MAAIHNLSDSLQGILVELSEKIGKLEEKNTQLEERTKELETKELESKTKLEELVVENGALKDRVTHLEKQLSDEADSKLKDLIGSRQSEAENRLSTAEGKILDHDKLVDRLESCEKKLASFYGEDTNILGRVGHLETRFKDFKKNEDIKLAQQMEGLVTCQSQNEELRDRVANVEDGLRVARRLTDILHESKLERAEVPPLLAAFKTDNRLLDDDSIVDVTGVANRNKDSIDALIQSERERESRLGATIDKMREDIEALQRDTEPAHKYECFGSDQAVKIYQIETKLKELEGMSASSVEGRLQLMDGRIESTTSQMDRILNMESSITSNFDRIGTDYVHMSRLISDINEELHGNEHKMQDFLVEMRNAGKGQQSYAAPASSGTDGEQIAKLTKDIKAIEQMIHAAEHQMTSFADDCKDSLLAMQENNDKKIDVLAVWVSKNINLLASSTRKKFKRLLAGDNLALLSGQNRAGHCLSCNQSKRPLSASHPKTRVSEGRSPIFKITHVDHPPPDGTNNNIMDNNHSLMSDTTEGGSIGPAFKMTVPASLRMKVSSVRQHGNEETLLEDNTSEGIFGRGGEGDDGTPDVDPYAPDVKATKKSQSAPRKFFTKYHNNGNAPS